MAHLHHITHTSNNQCTNIIFFRSFVMDSQNKVTNTKPFISRQEPTDIIQMVSTQLEKKDVIIFGMLYLKFCSHAPRMILEHSFLILYFRLFWFRKDLDSRRVTEDQSRSTKWKKKRS